MTIIPIRPKRDPFDANRQQAAVTKYLRSFASDFVRDISHYPPAQPWRHPPPRTGPRAGGRRTGTLGRNWSTQIRFTADSVTITNPTPYGIYVQGNPKGPPRRRQTPNMQARGWPNVPAVATKTRDRHAPALRRELGR